MSSDVHLVVPASLHAGHVTCMMTVRTHLTNKTARQHAEVGRREEGRIASGREGRGGDVPGGEKVVGGRRLKTTASGCLGSIANAVIQPPPYIT